MFIRRTSRARMDELAGVRLGTVSGELQRAVIHDVLHRAGLTGPDQELPAAVKVRHGRNTLGRRLHYYLNFADEPQSFTYAYAGGTDWLAGKSVRQGERASLPAWGVAIIAED